MFDSSNLIDNQNKMTVKCTNVDTIILYLSSLPFIFLENAKAVYFLVHQICYTCTLKSTGRFAYEFKLYVTTHNEKKLWR